MMIKIPMRLDLSDAGTRRLYERDVAAKESLARMKKWGPWVAFVMGVAVGLMMGLKIGMALI